MRYYSIMEHVYYGAAWSQYSILRMYEIMMWYFGSLYLRNTYMPQCYWIALRRIAHPLVSNSISTHDQT